jgi:hypothetical protein
MVRGIDQANGRLNRLQKNADLGSKRINAMKTAFIGLFSIYAARRLANIGVELFKLGAAAGATHSRFLTVFGESADAIERFRGEWAAISGLSTREFEDLTSRAAAMTQGMGAATVASAEFAEQILRLGGDLASFNDLTTAQAVDAIVAAMAGENERLKRFNITIRENIIVREALAATGKKSAADLTLLERATAKLDYITRFAGVAMGDLARTATETDNVMKQLDAAWRNFNDKLGSFLARSPLITNLLIELKDAINAMTTILGGSAQEIKDTFADLGEIAGVAFVAAFTKALAEIPRLFTPDFIEKLPGFRAVDFLGDALVTQMMSDAEDALHRIENRARRISQRPLTGEGAGAGAGGGEAPPGVQLPSALGATARGTAAFGEIGSAFPEMQRVFEDYNESLKTTATLYSLLTGASGTYAEKLRFVEEQTNITLRTLEDYIALGMDPQDAIVTELVDRYNALTEAQRVYGELMEESEQEIKEMGTLARDGFRGMSILLSDFVTGGIQGFEDLGTAMLRMFQRLALEAAFEDIGRFLKIPGFQSGGVVPGPIGSAQLAVVHGGETITPARQQPLSVQVVNNFNIKAWDGLDVMQTLEQHKGTIAAVVGEAARDSEGFRQLLGGG